jgi:phosphatidylethanolamine/phosphatidyl-N-methylethanolamine N-methyltransferase
VELQDTLRTYKLYARGYDIMFGPIFHPGRKAAVELANDRPNQLILEVGVGTGLSLPYFRKDAKVTGIDVSPEMLDKARRRVDKLGLTQVEGILEMDAEAMSFPDDSFDAVLALYVASVVPSPARFGAEMRRVCRPGGSIVIVNHFTSQNPLLRLVEHGLSPLAGKIGFHSDFPLETFLDESGLKVRDIQPSNLFGYWTLLRCINDKPAGRPA